MKLQDCNPFLRAAQIQSAVLEGAELRYAYDHRIFYILEGEGCLILEDGSHPLVMDTILYLAPQTGYYFKGRMRVVVLNFDLTRAQCHRFEPICPQTIKEFSPDLVFDQTLSEDMERVMILPDRRTLRADLLQIAADFRKGEPIADVRTSGALKGLLAALLAPREKESMVRQVERYIELYAAEIEDNEQIGRAFGYHPVYLATLFREQTGQSLHQAILRRRIALACQFLSRTDHSVEEIAFETGFSSRSHFCTVFKRKMGCSPKKYRETP